jgi:hypothetical protein
MERRNLLRTTAALAVVAMLPACTAAQVQTAKDAFNTAVSDLNGIASGLATAGVTLGGVLGINSGTLQKIGTDIGGVQTILSAGANAITTAGASTLSNFENIFNNIVSAANSVGSLLPSPFGLVLTAANALLPGIENAFNNFFTSSPVPVVSAAPPPTAMRSMRFADPGMTPDQARTILQNPFLAAAKAGGAIAH